MRTDCGSQGVSLGKDKQAHIYTEITIKPHLASCSGRPGI
jgi:hypothetical protein